MNQAATTKPSVGVIGLGQMGHGIAVNLRKAGLLHAVHDVSRPAIDRFSAVGASLITSDLRQLGTSLDIVVLVVPSSSEVAQCLDGPDGILSVDRPGQILLDLTTSDPDRTKALARRAVGRGRSYLDAGMSGGAVAADAGRLTLMVGGDRHAFDRCRPVFEAIADMSKVRHVGPSGAGHTIKLVHNMICHTIFMATAEGCRIAERAGIDLATAIDVINCGNARSFVSEQRFPTHILSGKWDGRSTVSNLEKDLRKGVEMAKRLGAPVRFSAETAALLARAVEADMSQEDFTLIYREFDRLAR